MPYPIVANPRPSVSIRIIDVEIPIQKLEDVTYTWNHTFSTVPHHWSIFTSIPKTRTFKFHYELLLFERLDNVSHRWNGLGGFVYIPSFPQLNRNATTWPHAT